MFEVYFHDLGISEFAATVEDAHKIGRTRGGIYTIFDV